MFIFSCRKGRTFIFSYYEITKKPVMLGKIEYLNEKNTRNKTNIIKVTILRSRRWYVGVIKTIARDIIRNRRPQKNVLLYKIDWEDGNKCKVSFTG